MAKKKLRIGIIGVGAISGVHISGYEKYPNAEIVAMADVVKANLASKGEAHGVPEEARFTDHKTMLKVMDLDAVSITTPNFMHAPIAIDCLKAGVHVLCEKPMAMNAVEGKKMCDAAHASGAKLQIGLHEHFDTDTIFAKKVIDDGKLGNIYYARVRAVRRRGCPSWGVFGQLDKQGGGGLIDIGVHEIDRALYLMGYPKPVSVSGSIFRTIGNKPGHVGMFGKWDHKTYTVEDFATALVKFENGAAMNIECAFNVNLDQNDQSIHIVGDKGGIGTPPLVMQMEMDGILMDCTPQHVDAMLSPDPNNLYAHQREIFSFCDNILADKPVHNSGDDALLTQKIIDGIFKSSKTGKEVIIK